MSAKNVHTVLVDDSHDAVFSKFTNTANAMYKTMSSVDFNQDLISSECGANYVRQRESWQPVIVSFQNNWANLKRPEHIEQFPKNKLDSNESMLEYPSDVKTIHRKECVSLGFHRAQLTQVPKQCNHGISNWSVARLVRTTTIRSREIITLLDQGNLKSNHLVHHYHSDQSAKKTTLDSKLFLIFPILITEESMPDFQEEYAIGNNIRVNFEEFVQIQTPGALYRDIATNQHRNGQKNHVPEILHQELLNRTTSSTSPPLTSVCNSCGVLSNKPIFHHYGLTAVQVPIYQIIAKESSENSGDQLEHSELHVDLDYCKNQSFYADDIAQMMILQSCTVPIPNQAARLSHNYGILFGKKNRTILKPAVEPFDTANLIFVPEQSWVQEAMYQPLEDVRSLESQQTSLLKVGYRLILSGKKPSNEMNRLFSYSTSAKHRGYVNITPVELNECQSFWSGQEMCFPDSCSSKEFGFSSKSRFIDNHNSHNSSSKSSSYKRRRCRCYPGRNLSKTDSDVSVDASQSFIQCSSTNPLCVHVYSNICLKGDLVPTGHQNGVGQNSILSQLDGWTIMSGSEINSITNSWIDKNTTAFNANDDPSQTDKEQNVEHLTTKTDDINRSVQTKSLVPCSRICHCCRIWGQMFSVPTDKESMKPIMQQSMRPEREVTENVVNWEHAKDQTDPCEMNMFTKNDPNLDKENPVWENLHTIGTRNSPCEHQKPLIVGLFLDKKVAKDSKWGQLSFDEPNPCAESCVKEKIIRMAPDNFQDAMPNESLQNIPHLPTPNKAKATSTASFTKLMDKQSRHGTPKLSGKSSSSSISSRKYSICSFSPGQTSKEVLRIQNVPERPKSSMEQDMFSEKLTTNGRYGLRKSNKDEDSMHHLAICFSDQTHQNDVQITNDFMICEIGVSMVPHSEPFYSERSEVDGSHPSSISEVNISRKQSEKDSFKDTVSDKGHLSTVNYHWDNSIGKYLSQKQFQGVLTERARSSSHLAIFFSDETHQNDVEVTNDSMICEIGVSMVPHSEPFCLERSQVDSSHPSSNKICISEVNISRKQSEKDSFKETLSDTGNLSTVNYHWDSSVGKCSSQKQFQGVLTGIARSSSPESCNVGISEGSASVSHTDTFISESRYLNGSKVLEKSNQFQILEQKGSISRSSEFCFNEKCISNDVKPDQVSPEKAPMDHSSKQIDQPENFGLWNGSMEASASIALSSFRAMDKDCSPDTIDKKDESVSENAVQSVASKANHLGSHLGTDNAKHYITKKVNGANVSLSIYSDNTDQGFLSQGEIAVLYTDNVNIISKLEQDMLEESTAHYLPQMVTHSSDAPEYPLILNLIPKEGCETIVSLSIRQNSEEHLNGSVVHNSKDLSAPLSTKGPTERHSDVLSQTFEHIEPPKNIATYSPSQYSSVLSHLPEGRIKKSHRSTNKQGQSKWKKIPLSARILHDCKASNPEPNYDYSKVSKSCTPTQIAINVSPEVVGQPRNALDQLPDGMVCNLLDSEHRPTHTLTDQISSISQHSSASSIATKVEAHVTKKINTDENESAEKNMDVYSVQLFRQKENGSVISSCSVRLTNPPAAMTAVLDQISYETLNQEHDGSCQYDHSKAFEPCTLMQSETDVTLSVINKPVSALVEPLGRTPCDQLRLQPLEYPYSHTLTNETPSRLSEKALDRGFPTEVPVKVTNETTTNKGKSSNENMDVYTAHAVQLPEKESTVHCKLSPNKAHGIQQYERPSSKRYSIQSRKPPAESNGFWDRNEINLIPKSSLAYMTVATRAHPDDRELCRNGIRKKVDTDVICPRCNFEFSDNRYCLPLLSNPFSNIPACSSTPVTPNHFATTRTRNLITNSPSEERFIRRLYPMRSSTPPVCYLQHPCDPTSSRAPFPSQCQPRYNMTCPNQQRSRVCVDVRRPTTTAPRIRTVYQTAPQPAQFPTFQRHSPCTVRHPREDCNVVNNFIFPPVTYISSIPKAYSRRQL